MKDRTKDRKADLELRVKELERRIHFLAAGFVLVLMAAAGLEFTKAAAADQEAPRHLTVRGLTVIDENGVARVQIGAPVPDPIRPDGEPGRRKSPNYGMTIHGANGQERGGFGVHGDGTAVLGLDGPDGAEQAHLVVYPHGQSMLLLREPGGLRSYLGVDSRGTGLMIFDGRGQPQAQWRLTREGEILGGAASGG